MGRIAGRIGKLALLSACFLPLFATPSRGQATSDADAATTIHGVVLNATTREPIARALVSSADNHFAGLTNNEGRFEFTISRAIAGEGGSGDAASASGPIPAFDLPRLTARKPGFMADSEGQIPLSSNIGDVSRDLTLMLVPEGLIVGTVSLPNAEAPDTIGLQIFRRQVLDGRAHWVLAGGTETNTDGQFRFADLPAGTYKLLTLELLDRDPLTTDPDNRDPFAEGATGPLSGYPPVYYQNAGDFGAAGTITVTAGQTQTLSLALVRQPYYRVRIPVSLPTGEGPEDGVSVSVYANGHKGPGFSLGYNPAHHAIEGMLPGGSYTVEATSYGTNGKSGARSFAIKGAPVAGPGMVMLPNPSIPVIVKEEFTGSEQGLYTFFGGGRTFEVKGPRRYLNVNLDPADDFAAQHNISLRFPKGTGDDALTLDGAGPGGYWVRINSVRGYVASVRSGTTDLLREPLVVAAGGAAPVEITMRDDTAGIGGTVTGVGPAAAGTGPTNSARNRAVIYCIPLADSSGMFTTISAQPDGSFDAPAVAPGAYRLLAFDREQPGLEYKNPEAMRTYEAKGPTVRVTAGEKERVTLPLISTEPN